MASGVSGGGRSGLYRVGAAAAAGVLALLVMVRRGGEPDPDVAPEPAPIAGERAPPSEGVEPAPRGARPASEELPASVAVPGERRRRRAAARAAQPRAAAPTAGRRFDAASLDAVGVRSGEIEWLRDRFESAEVERARLRAAAEAEGRPMTAEERRARWDYEAELEADLGSEAYDRLLYASGEPNQVQVKWVVPGTPAEAAGIVEGDIVLRFNGEPIHRAEQLRDRLADLPVGTTVPIVVQHGDETVESPYTRGAHPAPGARDGAEDDGVLPGEGGWHVVDGVLEAR